MTIELDSFQVISFALLFLSTVVSNVYFILKNRKLKEHTEGFKALNGQLFVDKYLALIVLDDFCKVVDDYLVDIKDYAVENKLTELQERAIKLSRLCKEVQPKEVVIDFVRMRTKEKRGTTIHKHLSMMNGETSDDNQ